LVRRVVRWMAYQGISLPSPHPGRSTPHGVLKDAGGPEASLTVGVLVPAGVLEGGPSFGTWSAINEHPTQACFGPARTRVGRTRVENDQPDTPGAVRRRIESSLPSGPRDVLLLRPGVPHGHPADLCSAASAVPRRLGEVPFPPSRAFFARPASPHSCADRSVGCLPIFGLSVALSVCGGTPVKGGSPSRPCCVFLSRSLPGLGGRGPWSGSQGWDARQPQ